MNNNLEKKIDALIDALGFDVEEVTEFNESQFREASDNYSRYTEAMRLSNTPVFFPHPTMVDYTTTNYKLTKRKS